MIPTYFINRESRSDRRLFMETQCERLGIQAHRFRAVEASAARSGRLQPTEVACLESHIALWQEAVRQGSHVLILEDDAQLSTQLPGFLGELHRHGVPRHVDVIRLEVFAPMARMGSLTYSGKFPMRRLLQRTSGTAAYIISPRAAAACLKAANLTEPVDAIIFGVPIVTKMTVLQTVPGLAAQLDRLSAIDGSLAGIAHSDVANGRGPATQVSLSGHRGRINELAVFLRYPIKEWVHVRRKPLPFSA